MAGLRHCGDSTSPNSLSWCTPLRPQEIFNWLYVVEETEEDVWEGGKLAWQVKYQNINH